MRMASGRKPQAATTSRAASRSERTRSSPTIFVKSASASSGDITSRSTRCAPARPVIRTRDVTSAAQPAVPGSSGRTCAASRALSSSTSTRRPSSTERYSAARSSRESGIAESGVPRARRKEPRTVSGSAARAGLRRPGGRRRAGRPGKASRAVCATCTARVVLPTPPMPARADTAITCPWPPVADARTSPSSRTNAARPVKSGTVAGSWAGRTGAGSDAGCLAGGSTRAGSASRMRCCSSLRRGRGSTPSSSASSRRVSAYTASASAWRPLRYSASISSSRSRSRSGCAAVSAVSSETASA